MRMPYQNELYHYGIPGMKWGIRRYQNPDGTLTEAGKKRYGSIENLQAGMTKKQADKAAIKERKNRYEHRRSISSKDIDDEIARIESENKLKDLVEKDLMPGKAAVDKFLSGPTSKVLAAALAGGLSYLTYYGINKLGDKSYSVDYKKLAEYVAPNPNKKK